MSMAAISSRDSAARTTIPQHRAVGVLIIATGVLSLALLALHPGGDAKTFADVLKNEASNRLADGIVHGGFIAVLAVQLVCYVVFSARLGLSRASTIAGLVFFAMGAMFLCGSMVLDGLATPAVAARYLAAPAKIEFAKALFVLIGTLIGVLMPIGLMFQSAAIAMWGWALAQSRQSPKLGYVSAAVGASLVAVLTMGFGASNPIILMSALAVTAGWAATVGVLLIRA
jgi:hypothetical protein